MGQLHIPGQPSPTNNPLLVLAAVGQHMIDPLNKIAENTKKEARHIYALGEGSSPGSWGSFCLACSDEQGEYIWPCAKYPQRPIPPSHITVMEQGVGSEQEPSEQG